MINLLKKIFLYKLQYAINFPKLLPINYTVSLTYNCNSRCKTCNIYNKKAKNLAVDEYEKIFRKIGKAPFWVTLSGGEPFLRNDIVDVAKTIYKYSKPKIINIPSNGILTDKIVDDVSSITNYCYKSQIVINLSVDGIEEEHDRIRNVKDNYTKVMETYKRLKELDRKNLQIGIHTVISKFNVDNFAEIADKLMQKNPDSYIT